MANKQLAKFSQNKHTHVTRMEIKKQNISKEGRGCGSVAEREHARPWAWSPQHCPRAPNAPCLPLPCLFSWQKHPHADLLQPPLVLSV